MTDCAIYTRISNDPSGEGLGVTRQLEDCRALADRLGWTVIATYSDNDISAYSGKPRPGYKQLLHAIESGAVGGVLAWHSDRLHRQPRELESYIDACQEHGVITHIVQAGMLDLATPSGRMIARQMGTIANYESEQKAARQRRANLQRAEDGGWWSSHRVFGYTTAGELEPTEADLVRQAGADILAGVSMTAIARRWNAAGVTTTRGAAWNVPRIKRLMVNPRYAGIRTYKPKGQPARVMGPGNWTPIFDEDTFNGVLAILKDTSRARPNASWERRYVGSHRYVCGKCGAVMKHTRGTIRGKLYHRYTCTASPHLTRVQTDLDTYVEGVALRFLRDADNLHAILAAKKAGGVDPAELHTRRAALAAQKDGLATLFAEGVLDAPAVRRESAKLTAKIEAIDAELAGLARHSPLAELLAEGADKLDENWAAASPDIRGKIIDELFTVVVHPAPSGRSFRPEFIEFRWR
jgi:DNA invertase Pin-like site-specific DNA recombinase